MTNFELAVVEEVKRIREKLAEANRNSFTFSIDASGRVSSGDVKITFRINSDYVDGVTANAIEPMLAEHLRRVGFEEQHQALSLAYTGEIES